MKQHHATSALVAVMVLAGATAAWAAPTIENVMKAAMKGDNSLFKRVSTNKGSDEDAQKLYDYVKDLGSQKPPKGDESSWKSKTEALAKAAESVAKGNKGSVGALQRAGNCKGCHGAHKED